jgi:hypothetical protein
MVGVSVSCIAALPGAVAGAELDSVAVASQLTTVLSERKAAAFAAEHPGVPGRFVAALYFPGAQIMTISAVYPAPEILRQRIVAGDYRQVYVDLSTAANQQGRLFVQDLGPPGLRQTREGDQAFDITWRDGTRRTMYDGKWKAQQLSEDEYQKRFAVDDAEYAQMLQVLVDAARMTTSAAVR